MNEKEQFVAVCLKHQEELLHTAKSLMDEAQQAANEYGAPKDRYDSFRTKQMRMADMYSKQFDNASAAIRTLQLIDCQKVSNCVEFGSIVKTDNQTLFISISSGKMDLDDGFFFAISVNVPIFAVMKGKKVGDSFTFNGNTQKILAIL